MIKNNVLSQNLAKNVYSTNENPLNDEECTTDEWYSNINNSSHHNNNNLIENDENDENRMFIRNNMNNIEDIEDYSNEPPLLEELGIRFDHILTKTQAVIIPTKVR